MRCTECRRQYSRFAAAPDLFRPTGELVCPHCGAGLRVGWWPTVGIALLTVVAVAAMAATLWFGAGDWVIGELGVQRRVLRTLVRTAVAISVGAALFAPGMYTLWVFGWYARRPTTTESGPVDSQSLSHRG